MATAGHQLPLRLGRVAAPCALFLALLAVVPDQMTTAAEQPFGDAQAIAETDPVGHTGDAADDPAIWIHPTDPSLSVVIGNDKGGALEVYDLSGRRIQRINEGFFGNVDVRRGFTTASGTRDIVVVSRRGIRIYTIDPVTRLLTNITDTTTGSIATPISGEGLCLYRSPASGATFVITNARDGRVNQHELTDNDNDGRIEAVLRRSWDVGLETEGCVTDEVSGALYISEETVGIWKYGAEPTASTATTARVLVDTTVANGGHILPDAEGLAIVDLGGGAGYLIASSQAASDSLNSFIVYDRQGANAFIRSFKVVTGSATDGCGRTDGIEAVATDLGPSFPNGLFVCQDNTNQAPNPGNQNFKFVPLERVVALDGEPSTTTTVEDTTTTVEDTTTTVEDTTTTVEDTTTTVEDTTTTTSTTTSTTSTTTSTTTTTTTTTVPPASSPIGFVAAATANGNRTTHPVVVPASVQAGDALLMLMATNNLATIGTPTGVTGWTQVSSLATASSRSVLWRKVAVAADAGRTVQVPLSGMAKANLVVAAYRGTASGNPVAAFTRVSDAVGSSRHVTPLIAVNNSRSWVVSWWTHKDSTTTALGPPPGVSVRANGSQTGSGLITALVADSGGPVPAGNVGGLAATASATASNAHMWTIVLAPAP